MTKRTTTFGDRMAVLKNARHERFAQLVAEGRSQDEAYKLAGYKPSRQHASRLATNGTVKPRIATIQAAVADEVKITVASVTAGLMQIRDKAEALSDSAGLSVARLAWMDAAKLAGLVVEKAKTDHTFSALRDALDAIGDE